MYKIAVFVSGRGSNLISIFNQIEKGILKAEIAAVVTNKKDCKALDFTSENAIQSFVISNNSENNVSISTTQLLEKLGGLKIDLIVLAGYLKKIPIELINSYKNKIINIHPALLPSFGGKGMYGINVHRAVFNSSAKVSGATIHFIDEIYDNGKIIDQEAVNISDVKTPEEIAAKVLTIEHKLLPRVIQLFVENKIIITDQRVYIN